MKRDRLVAIRRHLQYGEPLEPDMHPLELERILGLAEDRLAEEEDMVRIEAEILRNQGEYRP